MARINNVLLTEFELLIISWHKLNTSINSFDIFSLNSYAFFAVSEFFQKTFISSLSRINSFILLSHKFGSLLLEVHNSLMKFGHEVVHSFLAISTITIFNLFMTK